MTFTRRIGAETAKEYGIIGSYTFVSRWSLHNRNDAIAVIFYALKNLQDAQQNKEKRHRDVVECKCCDGPLKRAQEVYSKTLNEYDVVDVYEGIHHGA